jgi:probable rRNA maturation factor
MMVMVASTNPSHLQIEVEVAAPGWHEMLPQAEDICRVAALAAWQAADNGLALAMAGHEVEVSVRLTDDDEIAALNQDYRDSANATNVLSFAAVTESDITSLPAGAPVLLGDVVMAYGVVAAEADSQSKSMANHFSHLVVHGMLHLLGYDHTEEIDAKVMERLETTILATMGIADPYVELE